MSLERGTLLNNRYTIQEILGQGGMGAVYLAVDENLGVEIALKENLFTTEEFARQFRREAVILATLRHSNLTRVTDHFVIEGQGQYLVMDYIEGEDLRQRMDRLGLLKDEEVIIIGAAICDALSYLHSRTPPIVHRDIKPGNVKITPTGQIFIVDFGLAKIITVDQVTTTGARAMTPGYSPPEQYGSARTDHRSDIFSLGATLYAACTGMVPEDALARTMDQTHLTAVRKRNPHVSRRLAGVIEKALAVRPDDRYHTAEEFKQALLSVRGITTGRRTGDYHVTPPPAGSDLRSQGGPAEYTPTPRPRLPVPSSSPVYEPISKPRPRRKGLGWIASTILLTSILILLLTINIYPSLPGQVMAFFIQIPTRTAAPRLFSPLPPIYTSTLQSTPPGAVPTPQDTAGNPPVSLINVEKSGTPTSTDTSLPPTFTPTMQPPKDTPTPQTTPLGGGNGQIAFASNRSGTTQIWMLNIDGSIEPRQITDMPEGACQPSWSPDGARLVFISPCDGNEERYLGSGLYIINVDGSGLTPLPSVPAGDFDPAWSPDGRFIIFTSLRNVNRTRLYLIDLQDNVVTRLSDIYNYDRQPAWSPDGKQIAYVTNIKGPVQIWTIPVDRSSPPVIYTRSEDAVNQYPAWSADGKVILFTQLQAGGGLPSLVAGSYSEGQYSEFRFDLGPTPAREARYSPDGLWLVFEAWPTGSNHDIFLMSASGAGRVQLTNWEYDDFDPAWRPAVPIP